MPLFKANYRVSSHATARCQQRAISVAALELLVTHGDMDMPAGKGCVRRSISMYASRALVGDGHPPMLVDRVSRLTAVIADERTVVTVYRRSAGVRRIRRVTWRGARR